MLRRPGRKQERCGLVGTRAFVRVAGKDGGGLPVVRRQVARRVPAAHVRQREGACEPEWRQRAATGMAAAAGAPAGPRHAHNSVRVDQCDAIGMGYSTRF